MKAPSTRIGIGVVLAVTFAGLAQNPLDLTSTFDTSAEAWRSSNTATNIAWQNSGGNPDGYLEGQGTNDLWYFISPAAWAGDWRGYRTLKFDLAITSRHYADIERTNLVVIVGTNGAAMSWTADTPLWTWTHYEVSLLPSSI